MKNIDKLILDHKNLIESEASKLSQFVPLSVVQAEAYKIARKAAENYDENAGVKFSTYLHHSLRKLHRISTKHGGTVRLSEGSQLKINKLNKIEAALHDEHGRTPTMQELSEHSGMSLQQVSNLLKNKKKEISISNMASTPIFIEGSNDTWLHFVYHDLPDRDRFIFEHKTGFGGRPVMSNDEIAKKLKLSPSTVANRVKLISDKIAEGFVE